MHLIVSSQTQLCTKDHDQEDCSLRPVRWRLSARNTKAGSQTFDFTLFFLLFYSLPHILMSHCYELWVIPSGQVCRENRRAQDVCRALDGALDALSPQTQCEGEEEDEEDEDRKCV